MKIELTNIEFQTLLSLTEMVNNYLLYPDKRESNDHRYIITRMSELRSMLVKAASKN